MEILLSIILGCWVSISGVICLVYFIHENKNKGEEQ